MQGLFDRLSRPPPESKRLRMIRRNLQPFYQTQLALALITSIEELLSHGKQLEYTRFTIDTFRPPLSRKIAKLLEPDLACLSATTVSNAKTTLAPIRTPVLASTAPNSSTRPRTGEDCKKKWKFIRDGYNRFKKKKKLGTGSAALQNSKDKRHQQLLFLEGVSHHRSGGSNVPKPEEIIENADTDQEHASERFELHDENKANTEIQISDDEINNRKIEKPLEPRTPNKRLKRINNDDKLFNLWKERDEKRQTLLKTIAKRKDDDVELFCIHIAEVLRSLPPVNKAEAKKHLGIVLSNYEITAARTTSSATSTNTVCSDIDILSSTPRFSSLSAYDLSVPYASL
ncbi:hypothetical protein RN001_000408 [Aquatica leii]|uniref:BESS domain-containing protein n=1 Tax=Aquatica leii TaxID=1421715 RepID=A0AAN7Q724_9COLE|nr:hypothetical protein RN001_000408 [Aquatica leii]